MVFRESRNISGGYVLCQRPSSHNSNPTNIIMTKSIKLNNDFATLIRSSRHLALVTPPSYALSVFRLEPADKQALDTDSLNDLNRLFYTRISSRNDILLTRTDLNGIICIRLAVGSARTEEKHIQQAFELLCAEAELTIRAFEDAQMRAN